VTERAERDAVWTKTANFGEVTMSPVLLPAYLINNQAVLQGTMMHNHQGFCDITVLARCVAVCAVAYRDLAMAARHRRTLSRPAVMHPAVA